MRQRDLDVVVETRQSFNEHVGAFVGELIATRREEVQSCRGRSQNVYNDHARLLGPYL